MIGRFQTRPFRHPRERAERLPRLCLVGLALLLLAVWNPVTTPGPVLCWMRLALALPCPFCGGTRGVALCLRGRPAEALACNPLAVPALLAAAGLVAWWSCELLLGRQVLFVWRPGWRGACLTATALAILATWGYLLAYRREDVFAASWLGQACRLFW